MLFACMAGVTQPKIKESACWKKMFYQVFVAIVSMQDNVIL